jgi:multiple sugar transport system permease protein
VNTALSKKTSKVILYILSIFLCVVFLLPFYYTAVNSLKDIYASPSIKIQGFHYENYYLAVTLIPFLRELKSSVLLVLFELIPNLFFNLLIAYAFARLNAPGKNFLFMLCLSTLMLPQVATQIPQFMMYSKIGLTNTYIIWSLNVIGNGVYVFLFRQFFAGIPKALEEAAIIDGCSRIGILFKVFLPVSVPVIAIALFQDFCWVWSDSISPFLYLHSEKWPLATALFGVSYTIKGSANVQLDSLIDAASILITIPVIAAFAFAQKHLAEGIVTTGIKG